MTARGMGRIMNVASTAAYEPGPFVALYFASKAFVYSFSCALREELRGTGVSVTTFCPGPTETEFKARAGLDRTRVFSGKFIPMMKVGKAARIGYEGLMAGKAVVIPGLINKLGAMAGKTAPGTWGAKVMRLLNR
jgi:uncharacterized protein